MAYSSSSIVSSYSWCSLPLDLLISIAERLMLSDLLSFRSVCLDWRSVVPRPKQLPWYSTRQTRTDYANQGEFILRRHKINLSIPLPFPPYISNFLFTSNGWLLFVTRYYSYYLFDPVSQQKHWLPPLTREKMRLGKYINNDRSMIDLGVVSMNQNGGVVVAGVAVGHDQMGDSIGYRFCFIEVNGKKKSWHISKKSLVNRMVGIVGGGDEKRFYAIDDKWGLYLLEAGPLMRWRRFNLMRPKHASKKDDLETSGSGKKRAYKYCCGLREANDGYLEVEGVCHSRLQKSGTFTLLRVPSSGLRIYSKDVNAYCDEKWTDKFPSTHESEFIFIPRL